MKRTISASLSIFLTLVAHITQSEAAPVRLTRKVLRRLFQRQGIPWDLEGQAANDLIRNRLTGTQPVMVGRMGNSELNAVLTYLVSRSTDARSRFTMMLQGGDYFWSEEIVTQLCVNAGFFPAELQAMERFAERMLIDCHQIDILGGWLPGERTVFSSLPPLSIRLRDLEPYGRMDPWTSALAGKRVLVVSPFATSVEQQYRCHREQLFDDPAILPEFELLTLTAVQSIGGQGATGFDSWFDALHRMSETVEKMDFDVAIVGAGAYGLPLGAHIKRLGRKVVHLGGSTQLLFGLKGKRWDADPYFSSLYNAYWRRPSADETPAAFDKVESGCYW